MSKASSIHVIFLAITLLTNHASALPPTQPNFLYASCGSEFGNYTSDGAYDTNLKTVLTTLLTKSSTTEKFYTTSSGMGPNTVYAQYYCRSYIGTPLCGLCIQAAIEAAMSECLHAKTAVIWYRECTLHYANHNLVAIDTTLPRFYVNTLSNVTDPTSFGQTLNSTMTVIVKEALRGSSKFATGEGRVSVNETVYCLVQCSPDLSVTQCESCLATAACCLMEAGYGEASPTLLLIRVPAALPDDVPDVRRFLCN